jgi:soluble lytic murein transglycosylase
MIFWVLVLVSIAVILFSAVMYFAFPLRYKSQIRSTALVYNLDPALIASVINAESKFRPGAVSRKGAVGLMQIMPSTAAYIAARTNAHDYDLTDPIQNIIFGAYYLRYLFDRFKDLKTVLIAYNAGEGNVVQWLDGGESLDTSPFAETNAYVEKVLNGMNFYRLRFAF